MITKLTLSAVLTVALSSATWSSPGFAQDPVAVDPDHHKVEFENAHVRVLRIDFPPGAMSVMHQHPCGVVIGLEDSTLVFHMPDGSEREAPINAGEVRAVRPTTHQPENRSGKHAEVILVELKDGGC